MPEHPLVSLSAAGLLRGRVLVVTARPSAKLTAAVRDAADTPKPKLTTATPAQLGRQKPGFDVVVDARPGKKTDRSATARLVAPGGRLVVLTGRAAAPPGWTPDHFPALDGRPVTLPIGVCLYTARPVAVPAAAPPAAAANAAPASTAWAEVAAPAAAAAPMRSGVVVPPGWVADSADIPPLPIAAAQRCPNWCWAAGLEMLCRSQGLAVPQEFFVERIYGPTRPCEMSGPWENIKRAIDGVSRVVNGRTVTLSAAYSEGPPTDPVGMIRAIRDGRPFLLAHTSHVYTCYGISWASRPGYVQVTELRLIDPLWVLEPTRTELTVFHPLAWGSMAGVMGTLELLVRRS